MAQTIANRPLSSMSSDVLERNQTVSNMIPRLKAQPNTLRNLGTCRFCGTGLRHTFVDLGMSPPCETILERAQLNQMEAFYPLHVFVCDQCFLVQLQEYVTPEDIFTEYAYFSSYSDSWLAHAKAYAKLMIERSKLNAQSHIVELGSNDGYLLQYFVEAGIPVLGIEPAANVARGAIARVVPTLVKFFSAELAEELARDGMQADLLVGNNVLAQVPDLRGFVKGMKILLRPNGIITLEFPHLMRLIAENQFDTIYHEHFSYFSFLTVKKILAEFGLTVFEVDELPTHGGSLRIYARHEQDNSRPVTLSVQELEEREEKAGFTRLETYFSFAEKVKETKRKILDFLIQVKREEKSVVGYGAPGKGNTLLNYCGIRSAWPESANRTVQHLVQQAEGHASRHALPGCSLRRSKACALHTRGNLRRDHRPPP